MPSLDRPVKLGVMFKRQSPPELLPQLAQELERAGFDEFWPVEDCFYSSGVASAATALARTEAITVGVGIMPAVARNPVFTAMEIATLCRLFPGRFLPGLGHGVGEWMQQIGALPASPLRALEEVTTAVRALLRGAEVNVQGRYVRLDRAQLVYPPAFVPPVSLGVRGPKSLRLSGRVADGTILAEGSAPAYVAWARGEIAAGQREAGRTEPHRLTVFAHCFVDEEGRAARERLRPMIAEYLARERVRPQLEPTGLLPELDRMLRDGGLERLRAELPDDWLNALAVVGTPGDAVAAIRRFADAGADAVILNPPDGDESRTVATVARAVLPHLR